jgi:hypothetical protein
MKSIYLLTLCNDEQKEIGKVALPDNTIHYVRKAINQIEGSAEDYYQYYTKDGKYTSSTSNDGCAWSGSYKDTVRWCTMEWNIDEITVLT